MTKRLCIISFSPIRSDGRVLRQIEFLAPYYQLGVVGYGDPDPLWENIEWIPIEHNVSALEKLVAVLMLLLGRLWHPLYETYFWNRTHYREALQRVQQREWDAFYANEWAAIPIAVNAAQRNGAPIVYDAHEYSPLERIDEPMWRLVFGPMIVYMLKRYTPFISASLTVCQPIADRYHQEFGLNPQLVLNAPRYVNPPDHAIDPESIHLVHHGSAQRNRHIEMMIEAIPFIEKRFDLTLMLTSTEPQYLAHLKQLAARVDRDRIHFINPVPPRQIAETLAQFDIELVVMYPNSFNTMMALPNKLFEAINAGLAIVIGPSPAMREIVEAYDLGCVSESFAAQDIAIAVNRLDIDALQRMKAASRQAAKTLNADTQMGKVVALYRDLLSADSRS